MKNVSNKDFFKAGDVAQVVKWMPNQGNEAKKENKNINISKEKNIIYRTMMILLSIWKVTKVVELMRSLNS